MKFKSVFLKETTTIAGPYEKKGPLYNYFDKTYNDFYFGEKSFEKAEIKISKESINMLQKKIGLNYTDIDLIVGGDLSNQIAITSLASQNKSKSFLGIYGACSTSIEAIIIASSFIDSKKIKNAIVTVSSHNLTSEKQFRNPVEYGAPRPDTATFTSTGASSILLTNEKTEIKIESATIGKIIDFNQNDVNNMGKVMAPAAADTIKKHLDETKRKPDYYDLILTGDLGIYGREILIEYMLKEYNIDLSNNYNDCGTMLYDLNNQKEVKAGGSGPVCSALVNFSYIYQMLRKKKMKRVLLVATGALFSPTTLNQKENILSIAHAISLEAL